MQHLKCIDVRSNLEVVCSLLDTVGRLCANPVPLLGRDLSSWLWDLQRDPYWCPTGPEKQPCICYLSLWEHGLQCRTSEVLISLSLNGKASFNQCRKRRQPQIGRADWVQTKSLSIEHCKWTEIPKASRGTLKTPFQMGSRNESNGHLEKEVDRNLTRPLHGRDRTPLVETFSLQYVQWLDA